MQHVSKLCNTHCCIVANLRIHGWRCRNDGNQKGAERLMWRTIYLQLAEEAKSLGIPASAVPAVAEDADADTLKAAHQLLTNILASLSSSGL